MMFKYVFKMYLYTVITGYVTGVLHVKCTWLYINGLKKRRYETFKQNVYKIIIMYSVFIV